MSYNGLQIKAPLTPASAGAYSGDALDGRNITWFEVPRKYLGGVSGGVMLGTYTPSELITLWFGEDLDSRMDGLNYDAYYDDYVEGIGMGFDNSDFVQWRRQVTTATMVSGVIAFLPKISTTLGGDVPGYLDWNEPWGLVYDVDVLYKSMSGDVFFAMALGSALNPSDTQVDTLAYAEMVEEEWHRAGNNRNTPYSAERGLENSTYPQAAYEELTGDWFYGADSEPSEDWNLAPTFGLEAIGYDSYDKWSSGFSGTLLDANEALHSNELFRYSPDQIQDTEWENDPSILSVASAASYYAIRWQYHWNVRQIFAGGYHAGYQDGNSITYADSDAPWRKTQEQEEKDMADKIDNACDLIAPLLETTEFPKRLINHIQRKRKIPNNMVSAFGYVAEQMYAAGTLDTLGALDGTEGEAYNLVTGDMDVVTYDDDGNPVYRSLDLKDVDMGTREGSAGTRGAAEARDDADTEAGTESDGSTRYEGY